MTNTLFIEDWGRIGYQKAWDRQTSYQQRLVELKRSARRNGEERTEGQHYLILCEHDPVFTLGKSGDDRHLLVNETFLEKQGITFHRINRGGDITYHGPGQLVVYPILDLEFFFTDVHRYIRTLEEIVIRTMEHFGVAGRRIDGFTGVWTGNLPSRKICAIGVHLSRWVSMHGLAFNIHTDLSHFNLIVPCGINQEGMAVTSLSKELNSEINMDEVKKVFVDQFIQLFKISQCEQKKPPAIPLL